MKPLALASLLALSACVIQAPPEEPKPPPSCPISTPMPVAIPKPVWPDTCVADWYAKATLPPCVEDYLQSVKTQQEKIAKKKVSG